MAVPLREDRFNAILHFEQNEPTITVSNSTREIHEIKVTLWSTSSLGNSQTTDNISDDKCWWAVKLKKTQVVWRSTVSSRLDSTRQLAVTQRNCADLQWNETQHCCQPLSRLPVYLQSDTLWTCCTSRGWTIRARLTKTLTFHSLNTSARCSTTAQRTTLQVMGEKRDLLHHHQQQQHVNQHYGFSRACARDVFKTSLECVSFRLLNPRRLRIFFSRARSVESVNCRPSHVTDKTKIFPVFSWMINGLRLGDVTNQVLKNTL